MAGSTLYEGWGRSTWSAGSWGSPILEVSVDGVEATGGVGSVSVVAKANIYPSGQEATGALGTVSINAEANVPASGLEATGGVGSVTVVAEANAYPTGQEATLGVAGRGGPTFTAEGDAQLSTAQKQFGTASLDLDGTGYVVSSASDVIDGNFTVEFWVYPNSLLDTQMLFDGGDNNSGIAIQVVNGVTRVLLDNAIIIQHSNALVANEWNHVAVMQNGNFINFYTRGFSRGQYLQTSPVSATGQSLYLGARHNQSQYLDGYIDEFRTSDIARYTANFTPSTTPFEVDDNTLSLLHFNGANGSTDISNELNIGRPTVTGIANVYPTSAGATGSVGSVSVEADANVPVSGLEATASVGSVTVIAEADVSPTGLEADGEVGEVHIGIFVDVDVTGLEAAASVGEVTVTANADVDVTGLSATGQTTPVLVWGRIVPDQDPEYLPEIPSQTPNWNNVVPNQNAGYTTVEPTQSPGWSDESPSQNPGWTRKVA